MEFVLNHTETRKRVQNLSKLSTLPHVAIKLMKLLEAPRSTVSDLTPVISADQILTARILKLANSSNLGFSKQISTLNLALVVIGCNSLRNLILSISASDLFSDLNKELSSLANRALNHAIYVGCGARILAEISAYPVPGEAFVAGLLHDIGFQVLLQEYPTAFQMAVDHARMQKIPLYQAERNIFGFDHTDIGSWLAEGWNLPQKLVSVMKYHHHPEKAKSNAELVRIIHLADLISVSDIEFNGPESNGFVDDEEILKKLKIYLRTDAYPVTHFKDKCRLECENLHEFQDSEKTLEIDA
jgi:HD-like signal output (HDOD) protein